MNNNNIVLNIILFIGCLCTIFIILKLCTIINWSWCWVLSPLWIPIIILLMIVSIAFIVAFFEEYKVIHHKGNII